MNRPQFEYKMIEDLYLAEVELNRLGKDGWELCGILYNGGYSFSNSSLFYFKRIKQEL